MGRAFEYRREAKEKRWGRMSRIFPKLAKQITIAAKEGGPDPDMNAKLRLAIQNAKAQNMPKNNIENAIKRAAGKDAVDYTELNYEGKGPHGVLVFVECATDNTNRTVADVKAIFSKAKGGLVPTGSLEFLFSRKAVIEFNKTDEMDIEELEFELIDAGLEEIEYDEEIDELEITSGIVENKVIVYGDYTSFGSLTSAMEERKIEMEKARLRRLPTSPQEFTDEQMEDIEKMLDKFDEHDDVQAVYTNIA